VSSSPLSTPLSQLLIIFTIEYDNEFDDRLVEANVGRRLPISTVMWSNFMRFVGDGINGLETQAAAPGLHAIVDRAWTTRRLRKALAALLGQRAQLSEGLRPYPGGWRARKRYLEQTNAVIDDPVGRLPHYPMVLHRGGWPDGS
jgi:hypothetical protein